MELEKDTIRRLDYFFSHAFYSVHEFVCFRHDVSNPRWQITPEAHIIFIRSIS